MRRETREALLVAGSLATIVTVVLPLQTFLGNAAIYPCSLGRLLPELVVLDIALTSVFYLLARYGRLAFLLTALSLCVYLESGLLSLGLPELNGGFVRELESVQRAVLDAGVWIVIILVCLACARRLRTVFGWISIGVLALALSSLLDVHPATAVTDADPTSRLAATRINQETVVANVRYSPTRNILLFILDSMPGHLTSETMRAHPEIQAQFPGFVAYAHNIGMHECTKRGVPGLMTGRHYDPAEMPQSAYPMTMYGTNSLVMAALDAQWDVAFSPDLLPYGLTTLPVLTRIERVQRRSRDHLAVLRQSREVPYLSLFDLVAFRLAPTAFKAPILYARIRHAVKGRHDADGFWGEASMYPGLASAPLGETARPFLGVFHSWGAHPPWPSDLETVLSDKLSLLGRLMASYRERGIYDTATIIVTADHGLDRAPEIDGCPPSASAMLWIKPEGATSPFAISDARTSHAQVATLVRTLLARAVTADEAESILTAGVRLFRAEVRENGRKTFRDWRAQ